jgi:SAM-dependent methyltransferase
MFHLLNQKIIKKIVKKIYSEKEIKATEEEIKAVCYFYRNYQDFRSISACSSFTNINIRLCSKIRDYLYQKRKLGLYFFRANMPPQKYMREYILKHFPQISFTSNILEIGPGENPLFPFLKYRNWFGVDKYIQKGEIHFKDNKWAKDMYPNNKLFKGSFETLSKTSELKNFINRFDLVTASHSYEHSLMPIQSLKEAWKMLKKGGILALFVPDGYSDDINTKDPTHTVYINPNMMNEFFIAAGGFKDVVIKSFRPNADLVITAIKR